MRLAHAMIASAESVLWEARRPRSQVAILMPRSSGNHPTKQSLQSFLMRQPRERPSEKLKIGCRKPWVPCRILGCLGDGSPYWGLPMLLR